MEPFETIRLTLSDPVTSALVSAASFLVGVLLGNWTAIGRDKRKEFNEAAAVVRKAYLGHRRDLRPGHIPPSIIELDALELRLPRRSREGFRMAVKRYQEAKKAAEYRDSLGDLHYRDTTAIARCLDVLLVYAKPK